MRVVARGQETLPPLPPEVSWLKSDVKGKVRFELSPRVRDGETFGEAVYAYIDGKKVAEVLSRNRTLDCPHGKDCFEISETVEPGYRGKGIGAETLAEYVDHMAKSYHHDDVLFFLAFVNMGCEPWWRKTVDAIIYPFYYVEESMD